MLPRTLPEALEQMCQAMVKLVAVVDMRYEATATRPR